MMKGLLFLLLLLPNILFAQLKPTGWVNDYTNLLTNEQVETLNQEISNFEKKTDIEMTFAIVKSLDDKDIESFSNELFKQWGVGKADRNNGLLIVIAPNDKKWRIEIGYGLEPYLTDYQSQELGEDNFNPNFKSGDYYTGIKSFTDATIKKLGTSTWVDRMAYKEAQEKANHEAFVNFWWGFLYVMLSIIGIVLLVVGFIRFKSKLERERIFTLDKEDKANNYKTKISDINDRLRKYSVSEIPVEKSHLNKISRSKDKEELLYNYNTALNSIKPYTDLLTVMSEMNLSLSDMDKAYNRLSRIEKSSNIEETEKSKDDTSIPVITRDNLSSNISTLRAKCRSIKSKTDEYNHRSDLIDEFNKLLSLGTIDVDSLESWVMRSGSKFDGKQYGVDMSVMRSHVSKLRKSASNFNLVDKSFNNLDTMRMTHSIYVSARNDFYAYISQVEDLNNKYDSMSNTLRGSRGILDNHNNKLNKYLGDSDVSTSTKTMIRTFIVSMLAFKVTSDVISSFNDLSSINKKVDELSRKAQSEIDEEERKRRKKREEEEERKRRKKREEEEEESRRVSSYSSGSSWGSSSSGSDWGGFGGGDSGGGGSSGSW